MGIALTGLVVVKANCISVYYSLFIFIDIQTVMHSN